MMDKSDYCVVTVCVPILPDSCSDFLPVILAKLKRYGIIVKYALAI
jgi:hypothetical protein